MNYKRKWIGNELYLVNETESTNAELLDHPERYTHGAVLCARRQTSGRGRNQREWRSQSGGLYFSILLKDQKNITSIYPFILLSALAVVRNIQFCATMDIAIKWPNDVYINHRKVCGILAESTTRGKNSHIVIGIGLNVNNQVSHLKELRHPAVSLKECRGEELDPVILLNRIVDDLDRFYMDYLHNKFSDYLPELNRLLYSKGQEIELTIGAISHTIVPLAFTHDARLRCLENTHEKIISLGEM